METKLRRKRAEKGLTQAQLAEMALITERTYQRYEADNRVPNALVAIQIARALGCSVEDLFGKENQPF